MVVKEIIIRNHAGLQSKMAARFIQKASLYKSSIWIEKGERKANAKSLLGVLALSIGCGSRVILTVSGEDEDNAARELETFLLSEG